LEDCQTAIKIKRDYSKAYYRRAICYLNMKELRKSWNDLIYILKETPYSPEILSEINSLLNKFKIDLGNEEYAKIEEELNKECEEAKSYKKSDQPIINKNDEHNPAATEGKIITTEIKINKEKPSESKEANNKNEETSKKGYKKIQIIEEEPFEDNSNKESEASKTKKETEPEIEIDADLSKNLSLIIYI